jgi:hypothetical protein
MRLAMPAFLTSALRFLSGLLVGMSVAASQAEPSDVDSSVAPRREQRDLEMREAVRSVSGPREATESSVDCNGCAPPSRKRMTVEECHRLRHDINEAGRDLYRRRGSPLHR